MRPEDLEILCTIMNRLVLFLALSMTKYMRMVTAVAKVEFQDGFVLRHTFLAFVGRTICRSEARWRWDPVLGCGLLSLATARLPE